jgi:glycosyl transferase family 4
MTSSVLFVTRKWSPAVGGMETYCLEVVAELSRRTRVETLALTGKPDGSPPSLGSFVRFGVRALWHYLRRRRPPDVLHIGDMAAWPLALLAATRRPRPRVILSAHGTDVTCSSAPGLSGRERG